MLGDHNCFLLRDVTGCLLCTLLCCETAETTEINTVVLGYRILDCLHESHNHAMYLRFLKSSSLCYFIYNISFCHLIIIYTLVLNSENSDCKSILIFDIYKILLHFFLIFFGTIIDNNNFCPTDMYIIKHICQNDMIKVRLTDILICIQL
mgnify:CR=1 FL=1